MNKVIILRSLPGAGKSTYAQSHLGAAVCSADAYPGYYQDADAYKWTSERCKEAHGWCRGLYADYIEWREPLIIVDNTNLSPKGWTFYYRLALDGDYAVEFVELIPKVSFHELAKRNVHGVTVRMLEDMALAWQPLPDDIKATVTRIET